MFSEIKLEINNRNATRKSLNILRLKKVLITFGSINNFQHKSVILKQINMKTQLVKICGCCRSSAQMGVYSI